MTFPGLNIAKAAPARSAALRVGLVLAENYTLSALALLLDHLRLACDEHDPNAQLKIDWTVMASGGRPQRSSCGLETMPDCGFVDPRNFDYIIVVGGVLHEGRQITSATERYLQEAAAKGVVLAGLCTGSFILTRAGLMEGRTACVSWYHYQDFIDEFPGQPVVADRLFLDAGDRITCAGGAGTADFACCLIDRHVGWPSAQKASQLLLFDRTRSGGEAQPHPPLSTPVGDVRMRRALLIMEQNLTQPLSISDIARRLRMSTRQLERLCLSELGVSPSTAYRQLRMRYAHWLVNNTERSVTEIAMSAGFADCGHFSRQFKGAYGYSPSSGRRRTGEADGVPAELAAARVFG
jgi:transcriptional regulator GlxA family with amidase domain